MPLSVCPSCMLTSTIKSKLFSFQSAKIMIRLLKILSFSAIVQALPDVKISPERLQALADEVNAKQTTWTVRNFENWHFNAKFRKIVILSNAILLSFRLGIISMTTKTFLTWVILSVSFWSVILNWGTTVSYPVIIAKTMACQPTSMPANTGISVAPHWTTFTIKAIVEGAG